MILVLRLLPVNRERDPVSAPQPEIAHVSRKKIQPARMDRRAVSAGVIGFVLVVGTGAYLTWLHGLQNPSLPLGKKSSTPVTTTFAPTPTPTMLPAVQGTLLYKFTGHADVVNWVSWSPDNKRIVSASGDRTAQIWNALDGGNVVKYSKHTDAR